MSVLAGGYLIFSQTNLLVDDNLKSATGLVDAEATQERVVLDLSGKGLTSLSKDVTNRIDVEVLNLSNNQLTELPPEIGNMEKLEEINVENNRLTSLPAEIGKLNMLKKADFSNNRLTALPLELGNLIGVQYLNLSGYDSSKADAIQIKDRLRSTEVKF